MRRRVRTGLAVLAALSLLASSAVIAAPALGASNPALTDCIARGTLSRHYSITQLKQALTSMSASTKEYSDCLDVINRAINADIRNPGGGGTGSSGSGSFLPTPVIIILVVLILAAVSFGAAALRRRGGED